MFRARPSLHARPGSLKINGVEIATPEFIVTTLRGAIPHLTPDNTPQLPVVSLFLEELFDREGAVFPVAHRNTLPLARPKVLLCAPRHPESRDILNKPNTDHGLAIDTPQGSQIASIADLIKMNSAISPDACIIPYDIPAQSAQAGHVGGNRLRKMERRSLEWIQAFHTARTESNGQWLLLAPSPPELMRSSEYMSAASELCDGWLSSTPLPPPHTENKLRIGSRFNRQWKSVMEDIISGNDLVHCPLTSYSDAGHALTLKLDGSTPEYLDLNREEFKTDMSELGSSGYAKAYIHHLLNAREMTAQVILQLHNIGVIKSLFSEVREALANESFDSCAEKFISAYA